MGRRLIEFGRFRVDANHAMLYRDGEEVVLPPKAVKTLIALIEQNGELITKEQLMGKIWGDVTVEESNLALYLHMLRKALGESANGVPFIETLRGRGYRFTANVRHAGEAMDAGRASRVFGREKEIEQLTKMLLGDGVRLVNLSGVGGVGKTTLAREVGRRLAVEAAESVCFVELASIERPDLIATAIASELGLKVGGDASPLETVTQHLSGMRTVLILDNFEHLIDGAEQISVLHSGAPALRILVTSRIQLPLRFAREFSVAPLEVGSYQAVSPAVELFEARAREAREDFELTDQLRRSVVSICERVEGLPLAIELAAAKVAFMSPSSILVRLESRLKLLTGGPMDLPARQRAMRATLEWSCNLLGDLERELFTELSVFAGSFSIDAAEEICGTLAGRDPFRVLDVLDLLVRHNLLFTKPSGDGEDRFEMLQIVAEFAGEMLGEGEARAAAERRHAAYYAGLVEQAEPQLQAASSAEWLRRLEAEHDNIRAVLSRSLRTDPATGQRICGCIWKFWWLHGHVREGCVQLDAFLAQEVRDPEVKGKLLAGAAFLNRLSRNVDLSKLYAEEAAELAAAVGDEKGGALAFHQLGFLALDEPDLDRASQCFEQGLQMAERTGDRQILGLLNNGLGEVARLREDYERAAFFYGRALEYNREAGDRVRQTTNLINLGATETMRGDLEAAAGHYREGLRIASVMDDMNGTHYCLEGLAGAYWSCRDPARAAKLLGAADRSRTTNSLFREPADNAPHERFVEAVKSRLPESGFDENFEAGQSLRLDQAVGLALDPNVG